MKECRTCHLEKDLDDFPIKNIKTNLRSTRCKTCTSEHSRAHYQQNKTFYIDRITKKKNENGQYVWNFLKDHPCIQCGESDPVVLEFNHKVQSEKLFIISYGITNGIPLDKLKAEMNKCDVLCANCHRRHTAVQLGWYANIER